MGKSTSLFVRKVAAVAADHVDQAALLRSVGIEVIVLLPVVCSCYDASHSVQGASHDEDRKRAPRLMTFGEIAAELSKATARTITYLPIPHEAFVAGVKDSGAPRAH